jgi:diguanylate cyclase (GGDEF)-like protein/PAS domain S-box-containing protein
MTIDTAYFSQFYSQFDVGAHGSVTLLSAEGIIISRSPEDGSYVGRDMASSPLFRGPRFSEGTYQFNSPLDGVERLSAYRRSSRYPVMVLATRARDDVFAAWRQQLGIRIGIVLALVSVIALLGMYVVRQLLERQRIAAAFVMKQAEFRLLAEGSSDMVTRIGLDGKLLYVSPSSKRIVGWRADQLLGTPALAGVHPDDLPHLEKAFAALCRGEAGDVRVCYRTRHRDKGEIWLESTVQVNRAAETDTIDGVIAISRDMTARKEMEDRLAALATEDGLTGLANRRHFDQRLSEEWTRARRDGTPLSLLLIDVDHFKKFNDLYGHQAGDRCLQWVAGLLAEVARRPADVPARYGGEEFAVVLPNTDAAGCEKLGNGIRSELRAMDIYHESNPPSHRLTLSIGGATFWPSTADGSVESCTLIEAADQALYRAKESGRDRLVQSGQIIQMSWGRSA